MIPDHVSAAPSRYDREWFLAELRGGRPVPSRPRIPTPAMVKTEPASKSVPASRMVPTPKAVPAPKAVQPVPKAVQPEVSPMPKAAPVSTADGPVPAPSVTRPSPAVATASMTARPVENAPVPVPAAADAYGIDEILCEESGDEKEQFWPLLVQSAGSAGAAVAPDSFLPMPEPASAGVSRGRALRRTAVLAGATAAVVLGVALPTANGVRGISFPLDVATASSRPDAGAAPTAGAPAPGGGAPPVAGGGHTDEPLPGEPDPLAGDGDATSAPPPRTIGTHSSGPTGTDPTPPPTPDPTPPPVEQDDPPVDPTDPPVDPTEPPVEPPADPVDPPVDPEPPVEP